MVVLTGDDLARLGKRYLVADDEPYEINLTRQARPNVLFEAGMAFGVYPERTLIVGFGKTRPFTDLAGINILLLSDDAQSRQKFAARLKAAGCAVNTENKVDWLTAGDFKASQHMSESVDCVFQAGIKVTRLEAAAEESAKYKPKIWVDLLNDSGLCLDVQHLGWTSSASGIQIENGFRSIQLKVADSWCPNDAGVEVLHVAPSQMLRAWVQPAPSHTMADLQQRCRTKGQIAILRLRVNNNEVQIDV